MRTCRLLCILFRVWRDLCMSDRHLSLFILQQGVLEVGLPVVDLGVRHCLVWSTFGSPS
jgi:hypothetical protein